MSRKHNTRHGRARSHYPDRLRRRGQSPASVRMAGVEELRARQGRARPPGYRLTVMLAAALREDG